jgi:hypothetical protein
VIKKYKNFAMQKLTKPLIIRSFSLSPHYSIVPLFHYSNFVQWNPSGGTSNQILQVAGGDFLPLALGLEQKIAYLTHGPLAAFPLCNGVTIGVKIWPGSSYCHRQAYPFENRDIHKVVTHISHISILQLSLFQHLFIVSQLVPASLNHQLNA